MWLAAWLWRLRSTMLLAAAVALGVLSLATGLPARQLAAQQQDVHQIVLQEGRDGYVGCVDAEISAWEPERAMPAEGSLSIRAWDVKAALIRFDLSPLPADVSIVSARIELYAPQQPETHPLVTAAYRMLRPWEPHEATWLQASAGTLWADEGANGLGDDRSTAAAAVTTVDRGGYWYKHHITSLVQDWYSGAAPNYGVVVKGQPGAATEYAFLSANYSDKDYRPRLVVEYLPKMMTRTPTPTHDATATSTPLPECLNAPLILKARGVGPTSTATPTATLTPAVLGCDDVPEPETRVPQKESVWSQILGVKFRSGDDAPLSIVGARTYLAPSIEMSQAIDQYGSDEIGIALLVESERGEWHMVRSKLASLDLDDGGAWVDAQFSPYCVEPGSFFALCVYWPQAPIGPFLGSSQPKSLGPCESASFVYDSVAGTWQQEATLDQNLMVRVLYNKPPLGIVDCTSWSDMP